MAQGIDVYENEQNVFFEDWTMSEPEEAMKHWDRRLKLLTSFPQARGAGRGAHDGRARAARCRERAASARHAAGGPCEPLSDAAIRRHPTPPPARPPAARNARAPQVLVSPHSAFLTREALDNIAGTTILNLREAAAGAAVLTNQVNAPKA